MGIQRVDAFVAALQKARSEKAVQKIANQEYRYLCDSYDVLSSKRYAFTQYRKAVKSTFPTDDDPIAQICLKTLRPSQDEATRYRQHQNEQVANEQRNLRPIRDVDGHITTCEDLLNGKSYYDLILGLAGLTGRRVSEIAITSRFDLRTEMTVWFQGQLKTRGVTDRPEGYEIPTLTYAETVVAALARLREWKPELVAPANATIEKQVALSKRFHNRASTELCKRCRKTFGALKVKDLRPVYGELAYLFADDPTIAKKRYMSDILGHGLNDNATGESYLDFYIADPAYQ